MDFQIPKPINNPTGSYVQFIEGGPLNPGFGTVQGALFANYSGTLDDNWIGLVGHVTGTDDKIPVADLPKIWSASLATKHVSFAGGASFEGAVTASTVFGTASLAVSASFAETASFALTGVGGGGTGSVDPTANFSRSFTLNEDWQTATSASQDLTTGMWVLSIQTTNGIGHDNITYIGQFFWQSDGLDSTDEQDSEILLHRAGKFAGTGSLFARTFHSASTELALQIKTIVAGESAQDYAFNFRKLI